MSSEATGVQGLKEAPSEQSVSFQSERNTHLDGVCSVSHAMACAIASPRFDCDASELWCPACWRN